MTASQLPPLAHRRLSGCRVTPVTAAVVIALTTCLRAATAVAPTPSFAPGTKLIMDTGTNWYYFDQGAQADTSWATPGTSLGGGWKYGQSPLGFGSVSPAPASLVDLGSGTQRRVVVYFRRDVTVALGGGAVDHVTMDLLQNDGAVVYVNGVVAATVNVNATALTATTLATTAVMSPNYTTYVLPGSLLRPGGNTFAVEVHTASTSTKTLIFDARLSYTLAPSSSATPSAPPTPSLSTSLTASATRTPSSSRTVSRSPTPSVTATPTQSPLPPGPEQVKFTDWWSYLDTGMPAASAWTTVAFNDSAWKNGRAAFGACFAFGCLVYVCM